ncbi:hypothetical protein [Campylobacter fetus]|uniref:hypothetical protein n=1 Tax=Campylobacter fetus TaxID=196 RepID=UPI000AA16BD7|nr:hypothetical protein [Campylobacter fetus]EAI4321371.1 hypothetical protein [Campylobacter fetus]EAI4390627.1 hypothetical protein [Campylobacter fetus]UEA64661.1 hypothetical protein LK457_06295 [Campylobacter fetus subsp. testudinum]
MRGLLEALGFEPSLANLSFLSGLLLPNFFFGLNFLSEYFSSELLSLLLGFLSEPNFFSPLNFLARQVRTLHFFTFLDK